ncbi:hypothetical protein HYU95_02580 [Candidatus Daviesbacteria bacterium]|nr:hypothetical protein [Candidatus Daviesbacteria bacterium]
MTRLLAALGILIVLGYLAAIKTLDFNSQNIQPQKKLSPLSYSAWIPTWDQDKVLESLATSSAKLSYVSPVWYKLNPRQKIEEIKDSRKDQIKALLTQKGVKIIPVIFNEFDGQRISDFLKDKQNYQIQIQNLINLALEAGYQGYDLDFEEMNPDDRKSFTEFISDFAAKLHEKGLMLFVSVHAQSGTLSDRSATKAQDLKQIAKYADFIRVMIYDYHNIKTDPGPITPVKEYKQVLEYTAKIIPAEKLVVGLPFYGYQWNKFKNSPVEYQTVQDIAKKTEAGFKRDEVSYEQVINFFENGIENVIWVEDSESVLYKIKIAREYGIYQFVFWRLGGEDLSLWEKI